MNNQDKSELLRDIREDSFYESCLKGVNNSTEKRQIMAFVEDVYLNLVEGLLNMEESFENEKTQGEVVDEQIPKE